MLKPDFNPVKFKITISVHENCSTFDIQSYDGKVRTYQEVIGALDIVKMSYFFEQSGINLEEYRKWEKRNNKRKQQKSK